jgi:hypothetical protein
MKCVFIIHDQMSSETMERQYLLMIAMLNFDFTVDVLFASGAQDYWQHHQHWQQKLTALELYGVHAIRHLPDGAGQSPPDWYVNLLAEADFIS